MPNGESPYPCPDLADKYLERLSSSPRSIEASRLRGRDSFGVPFHPNTGADGMTVSPNIIDAAHRGPELVFAQPFGWISCLLAGIRVVPLIGGHHFGRMR